MTDHGGKRKGAGRKANPDGRTAIDAARRLLLPRNVVSDDFNELIANCQQHNLDVAIVAEAYLRSELKIESEDS